VASARISQHRGPSSRSSRSAGSTREEP
jgi:hypothetical protein